MCVKCNDINYPAVFVLFSYAINEHLFLTLHECWANCSDLESTTKFLNSLVNIQIYYSKINEI